MASKLDTLPLEDLYSKKPTPAVLKRIIKLEDFSKISPAYCQNVCRLKCKNPGKVTLLNKPVDVLIVTDYRTIPGKYDRKAGQSEAVQASIMAHIMRAAGFAGLNYRVTNLLKCGPTEKDFPNGKAPTATTLSKCYPYLLEEIKQVQPKVVISLSTVVTKVLGLTGKSNVHNRGEILDLSLPGMQEGGKILITLHPRILSMIRQNSSGAMWGHSYYRIIEKDFKKAADYVRGNLKLVSLAEGIERQRKNIKVCRSLDDIRTMYDTIKKLPEGTLISIDTETTGLDPMSDSAKLLCIQFGWRCPVKNCYIATVVPLWHRKNIWFNPDEAWSIVSPLLVDNGLKTILHNGKFDVLYIYHTTGVRLSNWEFDTMLLGHALDSGIQGCYSLKSMIWDWAPELGVGGYEDLLPKLTKAKKVTVDEDGEEIEEDEADELGSEVSDG